MKDLFGKAILDYQTNNDPQDIVTETSISDPDELVLSYLFREYEEMPQIEKLALDISKGNVLDVGCGAGSHSLYLQEVKNINVVALDISPSAIQTCKLRGLKNTAEADLMVFEGKFDTILLLMNGAGMCGKIERMPKFLEKLKSLLADGGQVLMDSSDIIYMFDEDVDGGKWINGENEYYGEVKYFVSYKGESEDAFDWLYIDFENLRKVAVAIGFNCELLLEGPHYDYLAKLTL
ncbi:MAG TPA: class I SAM-dependent methyltransferase [Flavobacterium sp.]|jgi:SAM-dependent methyltransferase